MLIFSLFTLVLVLAASALPTQKRSKAQVITQCTVPNTVALTFDDGPWEYLEKISSTLLNASAKGTFFFNGNNRGCIYSESLPQNVKLAYDNGHQIAAHTWDHPHLNDLTWDQVDGEFLKINQALQRIVGVTPAFMRPPYGEYNDQVLEVASKYGQTVVIWDFDSGDSVGNTPEQSNKLYDDAAAKHPSTILALNHEVYETTATQVLPHAIAVLQKAGYNLVTLADCLGKQPYLQVGSPQTPDSSWTC